MPLYDYFCERCKDALELVVPYGERDAQICTACGLSLERVWITPPVMGHLGKEGSDKQIASMKQSFRERFVKKDIDDCRHKFGRVFDDSLVSAAAGRIQKGEKPI